MRLLQTGEKVRSQGREGTPKLITSTHPEVIDRIDREETATCCRCGKSSEKRIVRVYALLCKCFERILRMNAGVHVYIKVHWVFESN